MEEQLWWSMGKRHDSRCWHQNSGTYVRSHGLSQFCCYAYQIKRHVSTPWFQSYGMCCTWSLMSTLWNTTMANLLTLRFNILPYLWRSIGKGVLFKTFDVKVQVHFVPELWRQTFCKELLFLWNVTFILLFFHFISSTMNEEINIKINVGYKKINDCLRNIFQVTCLSKTSPQWLAYLNHIDLLIKEGIEKSIHVSLLYLHNRMISKTLQVRWIKG